MTSTTSDDARTSQTSGRPAGHHTQRRKKTGAQERYSSEEDRNIWSSQVTEQKIARYFGGVGHCKSEKTLVLEGGYEAVMSDMLEEMGKRFAEENVSYLCPPSLEDLLKTVEDETPQEIKDNMQDLEAEMVDILSTLTSGHTPDELEEEKSAVWYDRLWRTVWNKLVDVSKEKHQKYSYIQYSPALTMIKALQALSSMESQSPFEFQSQSIYSTQHPTWLSFWNSVLQPMVEHIVNGKFFKTGTCREEIKIKPEKMVKLDKQISETTTSTTSKQPDDEVLITVKPDFLICTNPRSKQTYSNEQPGRLTPYIIKLVGEVKTTKNDGVFSPQSTSESSIDSYDHDDGEKATGKHAFAKPGPVKKRKSDGSGPSQTKKHKVKHTSGGEGDEGKQDTGENDKKHEEEKEESKKDSRMDSLWTQHFIELLCMLRAGNDLCNHDYFPCGDGAHIFGLYIVRNKIYITCLAISNSGEYPDMCNINLPLSIFANYKDSKDYFDSNKAGYRFTQFCFPPLNVFNVDHFKALVKYLVWGRKGFKKVEH